MIIGVIKKQKFKYYHAFKFNILIFIFLERFLYTYIIYEITVKFILPYSTHL